MSKQIISKKKKNNDNITNLDDDSKKQKDKDNKQKKEINGIINGGYKTAFKDLPRLSSRITIINNLMDKNVITVKDGLLMSEVKANESKDDSEMKVNKKVGQWDRIKNILLNLAGLADVYNNNDKYYDKIKKLFDDYNENELSGDMNINLSELFSNDNKVLLDSVTWRIIKSCTQTIIFGPLHQLLTEYFIPNGISMNQLKEVKSKDGWNIKIYFNKNGIIRVVHNRQRNVEYNDSNFILEWQFSMTFDKECKSCIQSQIKSNGIIFNENETNEYKLNVKKILFGGDIIFH